MCINKKEKTIAIGDNLNTDIKGANDMKIDSLFISNGVHRSEFKKESELIELFNKHEVKPDFYQSELIW
jgi:ribonucleotide monophosphatase NagD (HAD superfamily)